MKKALGFLAPALVAVAVTALVLRFVPPVRNFALGVKKAV